MEGFKVGSLYTESFSGMAAKEIKDNLEAVAYRIEEKEYVHHLSPEEMENKRIQLSEADITLDRLEEEKKEKVAEFKVKIDPEKETRSRLIESIKFKSERRHGQLFQIDDQEAGLMYSFDSNGICVDSRPLMPNEKQLRIRAVREVEGA